MTDDGYRLKPQLENFHIQSGQAFLTNLHKLSRVILPVFLLLMEISLLSSLTLLTLGKLVLTVLLNDLVR